LRYAYNMHIIGMCPSSTTQVRRRRTSRSTGFADAEAVFSDPLAVTIEDTATVGEARFVTVGLGSAGEILVVVYVEREGHYRLISARRATPQERRNYEA